MFNTLRHNLSNILDKVRGRGVLDATVIQNVSAEIRRALLEADVALPVVDRFIQNISQKAIGQTIIRKVTASDTLVKMIYDEIVATLSHESKELSLQGNPAVIMMLGLQGSGKTTSTAKLGYYLQNKLKKKVLMASLDVYRPAAQEQLTILGKENHLDTLPIIPGEEPLNIAVRGLQVAKTQKYDVLLLDTAGRLQTDEALIHELQELGRNISICERILVLDAMTGQEAANIAVKFHEAIDVTSILLTRADADARGGAAFSVMHSINKPIKFLGVGEKYTDLEVFDAERIAGRILDRGDTVGLVEKAQEMMEEEDAKLLESRVASGKFDLNDMQKQLKMMKKLGGATQLLGMLPGMGGMMNKFNPANANSIMNKTDAILSSMTKKERARPEIINASRRKRIAMGSGTKVEDVNKLLKQHLTMQKMLKQFKNMGNLDSIKKMMNF